MDDNVDGYRIFKLVESTGLHADYWYNYLTTERSEEEIIAMESAVKESMKILTVDGTVLTKLVLAAHPELAEPVVKC